MSLKVKIINAYYDAELFATKAPESDHVLDKYDETYYQKGEVSFPISISSNRGYKKIYQMLEKYSDDWSPVIDYENYSPVTGEFIVHITCTIEYTRNRYDTGENWDRYPIFSWYLEPVLVT